MYCSGVWTHVQKFWRQLKVWTLDLFYSGPQLAGRRDKRNRVPRLTENNQPPQCPPRTIATIILHITSHSCCDTYYALEFYLVRFTMQCSGCWVKCLCSWGVHPFLVSPSSAIYFSLTLLFPLQRSCSILILNTLSTVSLLKNKPS